MKNYEAADRPRYRFELTGGHAAVDLANTVGNRTTSQPVELLPTYAALLAWCAQAGVLTPREAGRLGREARRRKQDAAVTRRRAIALREALFALFSGLARGRKAPEESLAAFNAFLSEAMSRLRIAQGKRRLEWAWGQPVSLDYPLWPLVRSAAELVASEPGPPIRHCAASDCAWLFLDRSRNGRRRWCDMAVCGNRAKNRRYYRRRTGRKPERSARVSAPSPS